MWFIRQHQPKMGFDIVIWLQRLETTLPIRFNEWPHISICVKCRIAIFRCTEKYHAEQEGSFLWFSQQCLLLYRRRHFRDTMNFVIKELNRSVEHHDMLWIKSDFRLSKNNKNVSKLSIRSIFYAISIYSSIHPVLFSKESLQRMILLILFCFFCSHPLFNPLS